MRQLTLQSTVLLGSCGDSLAPDVDTLAGVPACCAPDFEMAFLQKQETRRALKKRLCFQKQCS